MSKHEIIKHSSSYEGNGRSGAHINACLNRKIKIEDMCEINFSVHMSFSPAHPAVLAFTKAMNDLQDAIENQEIENAKQCEDFCSCRIWNVR